MALTLTAEQKSIYEIFSGNTKYIIPPYQRAYSWSEEQCSEFFEDIKESFLSEESDGYFIGNIVVANSAELKNSLEIIDGQQRLITLTLFIKVLYKFDSKNNALDDALWIKDRRDRDKKEQRVQTRVFENKDSTFLKNVLDKDLEDLCKNRGNNNFEKNICFFYNKTKEIIKESEQFNIVDFANYLLDKVSLLPIETTDNTQERARQKAITIFETINNRGLSLSTSDLFKARLYSIALNENRSDDFFKKWKYIYQECEHLNYTIDKLFINYMNIIKFKENIKENSSLRDFFLIKDYSPFYMKSITYTEIMNNLLKIINSLRFFREVQINSEVYNSLTKWFQIMSEFKGESFILKLLYEINLDNYEEIINVFKRFIKYIISYNEKNIQQDIFYKLISNKKIKKTNKQINPLKYPNKKALSLLSFYLNPEQKAIYPYYIIDISDDAEKAYFEDYLFKETINFLSIDMISVYIINDFYISFKSLYFENSLFFSQLKKSKIKYNYKLYELYNSGSLRELKDFIKGKSKIEKNRLNKFVSSLYEN